MYEGMSVSHLLRGCNYHFAIVLRQERNVSCFRWGHRLCPGSRHRPQRGLHDALGPLGRAFLMPRPRGVVNYLRAGPRSPKYAVPGIPRNSPHFGSLVLPVCADSDP
jgi:hypothetical protein